jgi:hypothetical protein
MGGDRQTPATLEDLSRHLQAECYQPNAYHVGDGWSGCCDAHCIEKTRSGFEIFYVERGRRSKSIDVLGDEAAACQAFIAWLDRTRWSRGHCIAFTRSLGEIEEISEKLAARGIAAERNDLPAYAGPNDPRYRLFVFGTDKLIVDAMAANGDISPISKD